MYIHGPVALLWLFHQTAVVTHMARSADTNAEFGFLTISTCQVAVGVVAQRHLSTIECRVAEEDVVAHGWHMPWRRDPLMQPMEPPKPEGMSLFTWTCSEQDLPEALTSIEYAAS